MVEGEIYGRSVRMQGSPMTLLVWKKEFDGDLSAFLTSAYKKDPIDIEEFLRIAWAMAYTYDPNGTRHYEEWLDEFDADIFDMREGQDVFVVINSAIEAELFCQKPTVRATLGIVTRGIRRRARRLMGAIRERARDATTRLLHRGDAPHDDDGLHRAD